MGILMGTHWEQEKNKNTPPLSQNLKEKKNHAEFSHWLHAISFFSKWFVMVFNMDYYPPL